MKETNGRHGLKSAASFAMAAILASSSMMSVPVFADMGEVETIMYDTEELIAEADDVVVDVDVDVDASEDEEAVSILEDENTNKYPFETIKVVDRSFSGVDTGHVSTIIEGNCKLTRALYVENGHAIIVEAGTKAKLSNAGNYEIIAEDDNYYSIYNEGELTLEFPSKNATGSQHGQVILGSIKSTEGSKLTFNGGTYYQISGDVVCDTGSEVILSGGNFTFDHAITAEDGAILNITKGIFGSNMTIDGVTSISGGTFGSTMGIATEIEAKEISGGTFNITEVTADTISGGTFNTNSNVSNVETISAGYFSTNSTVSDVGTISGGSFSGAVSNPGEITGGTFNAVPDENDEGWQNVINKWVADGAIPEKVTLGPKIQTAIEEGSNSLFENLAVEDGKAVVDKKLKAPVVTVSEDEMTASWDAVDHANGYEVVISKNSVVLGTIKTEDTTFDFTDYVTGTETETVVYSIAVTAYADEEWEASAAGVAEKVIVVEPTLNLESKTYIKGGNGFEVIITPNGNELIAIYFRDEELEKGVDYTVDGNVVTINDDAFKVTPGVDEGDFEDPFSISARAGINARNITSSLVFEFEHDVTVELPVLVKTVASSATFILAESGKTIYDEDDEEEVNDGSKDGLIVVAAGSYGDPLTNFTAASFEIDNDNEEVTYEIVAKEGYALLYHEETNTYEINVKPKKGDAPAVSEESAQGGIVIGYIQYQGGYGKGEITASKIRVTTEVSDNLYKELEVSDSWTFKYDVKEPTEELTVTVDFNHPVITANEADYQKMTLNVYSPKVGNITIALGKDKPEVEDVYGEVAIRDFKAEDNKYTVVLTNLPANDTYTVSIKGDGYRSAKTSLNLNEAKTVLFWNNAKEEDAIHVKTNAGETEKMISKNFLAGDIIMDNKIDLYDLSAVSSYFGKGTGTAVEGSTENGIMTDYAAEDYAGYVQYDLNRDGKVDIIDITMVIDGWAE